MATTLLAAELKQFKATLQKDRLSKVYVGQSDTPYLIQEATLSTTSDVFARALKHEDHFGGEKGALKFPEDDEDAWDVLLYWRITNKLPDFGPSKENSPDLLISSWCLADKYNIREFQDLIMLELIRVLEEFHIEYYAVKAAFENTPHGSPLRQLMAREALLKRYDEAGSSVDDMQVLDGTQGIIVELFKAQMVKDDPDGKGMDALRTRIKNKEEWEQYMVGGGPKQHWAYGDTEK